MHVGLIMECDYRYGETEQAAFDEAFAMAEAAEMGGLDGVWLAERHFAAPRSPLDTGGAGIPSVVSSPLIISSAIVARHERLRVGVAVNVLPLAHPIRMAEEVATVDHISRGRVEFGVGRSGFARAYEGYGISYAESRGRFQEALEVILAAWTNERFSYEGKYYQFNDVCVIPKPFQKPYPPLRIAATTKETFPQVGRAGIPYSLACAVWTARPSPRAWASTAQRGRRLATKLPPACSCASRCTWARPTSRPTTTPKNRPCGLTGDWPKPSSTAPQSRALLPTRSGSSGVNGSRPSPTRTCCGTAWPTAARNV